MLLYDLPQAFRRETLREVRLQVLHPNLQSLLFQRPFQSLQKQKHLLEQESFLFFFLEVLFPSFSGPDIHL